MSLIKLPLLIDNLINWYIWKAKIRECIREYHKTYIDSCDVNFYGIKKKYMIDDKVVYYFFLNNRLLENSNYGYFYSYMYIFIKKFIGYYDRERTVDILPHLPPNYQYTLVKHSLI